MPRVIQAEYLDSLPPADPRAARARGDLRRLNFIMGHRRILAQAMRGTHAEISRSSRPLRVLELGAGDGTLLLSLARRCSAQGVTGEVTLLDRHPVISGETRRAFAALHWPMQSVESDVFSWLQQTSPRFDFIFANLFLHHFTDGPLGTLLGLIAARTSVFITCEPRRSGLALAAARALWLLGCHDITRHDAVVSVRAGFAGDELSALWPVDPRWQKTEQSAGWFSHSFVARLHA